MTDYTTWAETICDPGNSRPLLQRPHALAGTDFGFTTDGTIALLLPASAWGREFDVHDDHGSMTALLDPPHWYTSSTFGAIRAWAGEPEPRRCDCCGKPVACRVCRGSGSHECSCGHHGHDCGRCAGTGHIPCEKCEDGVLPQLTRYVPLLVGGPTLDRNLVWKLLHGCPDPPETPVAIGWSGKSDTVVLRTAHWTGLVMPTSEVTLFDEKPLIGPDWDNPLGGPHYDEDAFGRPVYDPPDDGRP